MIKSTALWIVVCLAAMCVTSPGQWVGPTLIAHNASRPQGCTLLNETMSCLNIFFALISQCAKVCGVHIAHQNQGLFTPFFAPIAQCVKAWGMHNAHCTIKPSGPFAHFLDWLHNASTPGGVHIVHQNRAHLETFLHYVWKIPKVTFTFCPKYFWNLTHFKCMLFHCIANLWIGRLMN